ncbi:PHD and RING finger domain-containing protein 1-like protein [Pitangus sulphuratus]|nr:PHD and RING finger domain-containing protein 1-like protein [Pitangus sulphuratus]
MEAPAAVGARGSSSSPPSPSSPLQHTESTDTELEDHCPICLESWKEPSFVMPCLHRFCYACILQWADNKTECPLCKRRMTSILHSVQADDDFVEHVLAPPMTPPANSPPARGANREPDTPNFHHPEARQQQTATRDIQHLIGGFQLPNWMSCFSINPAIHQTLHSWFYQNLELLFGTPRDQRARATEQQRRREGRHQPRQRDCGAAAGQEHSPSSPTPGPARSSMDEMPGTSSTAIGRSPGRHTSASTNVEQRESQGEPAPPNSTGGSDPSPRGPQRPPKRKASSTEGSPAHRRPRH